MKYKHTIYLPRHDNELSHASYGMSEDIQKRMTESFTTIFGGCTVSYMNIGHYMMDNGNIVEESVNLVSVITDVVDIEGVVIHFIKDIKKFLKQESVLYTIEEVRDVRFIR